MGKSRNSIIISGIIAAFILGSVSSVTLIEASPTSDAALIAALNGIRDAILGITPTQTVTVQSLEGPEGPPGADGQDGAQGLSCENQLIVNDLDPNFVVDPECAVTACDLNGDGGIDVSELQTLYDDNALPQFQPGQFDAEFDISALEDSVVGDDNGVIDNPDELAELNFFLPTLKDYPFFPCTIIF